MSEIHIKQIATKIQGLFSEFIDCSDLSQTDKEYDTKLLTRCLAAYAIYLRSGCEPMEAARSVTDGSNDNGIDAIHFCVNSSKLFLVQSKWIKNGKGEPESGDVGKFCNGIRDLVNFEKERFNFKIQTRWESIIKAISSYGLRYEVITIYTGANTLSTHSTRILSDLLDQLNDADPIVASIPLNQTEIYTSLATGINGAPITLEIGLLNWGTTTTPHRAYYGAVSGEEVAVWWKSHGDNLFSTNLRKVLGTTDVNKEIRKTIEDRPRSSKL